MKVWMRVSLDQYQLPEAIADSAKELARLCNTTPSVIYSELCRYRKGKISRCAWCCVRLDG